MTPRITVIAIALLVTHAAHAQGTVTIFGSLDLGVRIIKNSGSSAFSSVSDQGSAPNRLGFKGEESLGDGLKASFHLEAGILPDTGQSLGQTLGIGYWNRQATVGLKGSFGEIRLGRDWTASYASMWIYDPSYGFGVADTTHVSHNLGQPTYFWTNNAISYTLPGNLAGFYGQIMAAPGEGTVNGRYVGGRFGYASGPFDVSAGFGSQKLARGKFNVFNIGGSYDLGAVKLMALYNRETLDGAKDVRVVLAGTAPVGAGHAYVSYARGSVSAYPGASGASQIGLGYVHSLSKRTALYANAALLDNQGTGSLSTASFGSFGAVAPTPGGKSRGFELGIHHFF